MKVKEILANESCIIATRGPDGPQPIYIYKEHSGILPTLPNSAVILNDHSEKPDSSASELRLSGAQKEIKEAEKIRYESPKGNQQIPLSANDSVPHNILPNAGTSTVIERENPHDVEFMKESIIKMVKSAGAGGILCSRIPPLYEDIYKCRFLAYGPDGALKKFKLAQLFSSDLFIVKLGCDGHARYVYREFLAESPPADPKSSQPVKARSAPADSKEVLGKDADGHGTMSIAFSSTPSDNSHRASSTEFGSKKAATVDSPFQNVSSSQPQSGSHAASSFDDSATQSSGHRGGGGEGMSRPSNDDKVVESDSQPSDNVRRTFGQKVATLRRNSGSHSNISEAESSLLPKKEAAISISPSTVRSGDGQEAMHLPLLDVAQRGLHRREGDEKATGASASVSASASDPQCKEGRGESITAESSRDLVEANLDDADVDDAGRRTDRGSSSLSDELEGVLLPLWRRSTAAFSGGSHEISEEESTRRTREVDAQGRESDSYTHSISSRLAWKEEAKLIDAELQSFESCGDSNSPEDFKIETLAAASGDARDGPMRADNANASSEGGSQGLSAEKGGEKAAEAVASKADVRQYFKDRNKERRIGIHSSDCILLEAAAAVTLPDVALLGYSYDPFEDDESRSSSSERDPDAASAESSEIYLNTHEPFCLVTVGVQGGGKSHTVGCVLESCLVPLESGDSSGTIVKLERPMNALVLHYDGNVTSICEAIGIASPNAAFEDFATKLGLPAPSLSKDKLLILVSPSAFRERRRFYEPEYTVKPLLFRWSSLTADHILRIMCVNANDRQLYISVLLDILRQYGRDGCIPSFEVFCTDVARDMSKIQSGPLQQRLNLLSSVVAESDRNSDLIAESADLISSSAPGTVVIADLTDSTLTSAEANSIFQVLTEQYRHLNLPGKILVVDEAHKFMSGVSSDGLSGSIVKIANLMRHDGMRLVISTQSPKALAPELLEVVSVAILHSKLPLKERAQELIAKLPRGSALVFSGKSNLPSFPLVARPESNGWGSNFYPISIRDRFTADLGVSVQNVDI